MISKKIYLKKRVLLPGRAMNIFSYVLLFLQLSLLFFSSYWLIISFFGLGKIPRAPQKNAKKRFLLLIPAHNEEKVIGNLVKNLLDLDYPKELYEICVIADNCTDKTAVISRNLGVAVLEHTSLPQEEKGKPHAIKYAFENIGNKLTEKFDAVAIFDADNLVTLNYLKEMNNHLLNGEKLVQCYLDTKNPKDNFITLGYAASYFYMNRAWQLARYKIGIGNAIGGTGFCIDTQVIKKVGWTARSLTEDLEFTAQCLLLGIKATWCHEARVYDEKPTKIKASALQRLRWARGHWEVCFKYSARLLLRGITKLDFKAFDAAVYLLSPARALLETSVWIIAVIGIYIFNQNYFTLYPLWLFVPLLFLLYTYTVAVFRIDAEVKFSKTKALVAFVFYSISYIPLFLWALFTYKNKTWIHTEHTKNISLQKQQ